MNFCILPAGAWGTAMALHLVRRHHTVTLVPRSLDDALALASERENRKHLSGYPLPRELQIGMEWAPALMEAEVVILACPSAYLRSMCRRLRGELGLARELRVVMTLCKGLEEGTNKLPGEVLGEELPEYIHATLSGPTFASQVAAGQPSAIVLAGRSVDELGELQAAISSDTLRVYTSSDQVGVELGGCLKNVYAIASGICDGLDLQDNSRAALLTRSLHELVRVGTALGGRYETFYGLSGLGDLVLTCNGSESRNRTFGELFAQGVSVDELIHQRKMTVEGYRTVESFHKLCEARQIAAPILEQIHCMLYEGQDAETAVSALMDRDLKAEAV